jgi:hypothetical protein
MFLFFAYVSAAMSILTVVAITFIRFVAVVLPSKAGALTSFRAGKYFNATLMVVCTAY